MQGFESFDEDDWRATLAELRLLVVSAGFAEWDTAMAAALDEEDDDRARPRDDVREYASSFASFLKVRSSWNLERLRAEVGEAIQDEEGRPVRGAILAYPHVREERDLLADGASDFLLKEVIAFAHAVAGEAGYFEGWEIEE